MRTNIVTANAGDKLYVKTDPVFQYDYGLILQIAGISLPQEYDVHFGNDNSPSAKTVEGGPGGVAIPDEYLRNGEDIHAWLFIHTGENDGESVIHIHIPVVERAAIDDEEITPIEHHAIEIALETMNQMVEAAAENVSHYPFIGDNGDWMIWDADAGEYADTGVRGRGIDADTVSIRDTRENVSSVVIHDGADDRPVDEMRIVVDPIQSGSGIPGPRNIRRLNGFDNIAFTVASGDNTETHNIDIGETVYGCVYYPMTGRLLVDRVLITKNCTAMDNIEVRPGWNNSGIKDIVGAGVNQVFTGEFLNIGTSYGIDTTGDNDLLYLGYEYYGMRQTDWQNTEINVQICVRLPEPIEYHVDPIELRTELGDNGYAVNPGKIAYMKYPCDTKLYIDGKVVQLQALILDS